MAHPFFRNKLRVLYIQHLFKKESVTVAFYCDALVIIVVYFHCETVIFLTIPF